MFSSRDIVRFYLVGVGWGGPVVGEADKFSKGDSLLRVRKISYNFLFQLKFLEIQLFFQHPDYNTKTLSRQFGLQG